MSTELRDRLDDLLADVPGHVSTPDPASAWRAGTRRRVRRRLTAVATVAVVAILGGLGFVRVQGSETIAWTGGPGTDGSVSTYPARIDKPLWQGNLPQRPGPIAGVVQRPDGWYAVSPTGSVWRIPGASDTGYLPSVSPDGTLLTYLNTSYGQASWDTVDLTTGVATSGSIGGPGVHELHLLPRHTPTLWSPDSSHVLVPVRRGEPTRLHPDALLMTPEGRARPVQAPAQDAIPVGWAGNRTLAWLQRQPTPTVLLTDRAGHLKRRIPLHLHGLQLGQITATSVLVAGTGLAVVTPPRNARTTKRFFHVGPGPLAGTLVATLPTGVPVPDCPLSWGTTIHVPLSDDPAGTLLDEASIQADPRLHIGCSVWAGRALMGTPYRDFEARLFDTRNTWWSWHWREVGLGTGAGLVAFAAGVVLLLVRRRRRSGTN